MHFDRYGGRHYEPIEIVRDPKARAEIERQRSEPMTTNSTRDAPERVCTRMFPCRYAEAKQCAHDLALGSECPKVCECPCHEADQRVHQQSDGELLAALQCELAFYFGAYHDQLKHNLDAAHCRENECERVKKLLYASTRAHAPVVDDEVREVLRLVADGNFNQADVIARARALLDKKEG